jgi:pimeloyl-ACP methyl ester carboxylesterase
MPAVRLLAALLATTALSHAPAFAQPRPPAAEETQAVKLNEVVFRSNLDNSEQRYVELVPAVMPEDRPGDLIIALHGHGSDRWQFIRDPRGECRGVRDAAARHHAILLSPDYRARTSWMGPQAEADLVQIIAEARRRHRLARVFITGGSMGGTSALIFTALHPELIDGVCSLNGTANMLEFDGFQEAVSASYGGTRQSKPEEYRKRSAELHPEKFTMPVAITTGGKDAIVPPQSALRLAEALRLAKRKTMLIHRPEGGHSTSYEDTVRAMEFILRPASR